MRKETIIAFLTPAMEQRTVKAAIEVDLRQDFLTGGELTKHAIRRLQHELALAISRKEINFVQPLRNPAHPDVETYYGELLVMSPKEVIDLIHQAYERGYNKGDTFQKNRLKLKIGRKK